eukprot:TRINITY_DN66798_c10_g3_i1.p2 TRINITY_DN66798_c10_g3~~TRINITY_DN66798_c10_g3_i1.p2  ORF type:complete len:191 (-),score=34.21 TRINITY_DN66798_c10_g3_i1:695-1267(-)
MSELIDKNEFIRRWNAIPDLKENTGAQELYGDILALFDRLESFNLPSLPVLMATGDPKRKDTTLHITQLLRQADDLGELTKNNTLLQQNLNIMAAQNEELREVNKRLQEEKEAREETFLLTDLGTLVAEYFLPDWRLISDTLKKAHPKQSKHETDPTWEDAQVSKAVAATGLLTDDNSPSVLELWTAKVD